MLSVTAAALVIHFVTGPSVTAAASTPLGAIHSTRSARLPAPLDSSPAAEEKSTPWLPAAALNHRA